MRMKMGALACIAMLLGDVAAAQTVNLQGCPATRDEALSMLSKLTEKSRSPSGTASYDATNLRFLGDPVLGVFSDPYNRSWLHIRLPRMPSAYAAAIKARHSAGAQRINCDTPDENGCYIRMKDNVAWGLHSLDFSKFEGRLAKEGEPDGRYLICFY